MPVSTRPALAIASMPSCGCEPCAARPAISTSSQAKPLWATHSSSVGRLGHDRRVRAQLGGHRLGADARELLVAHGGHDDVARELELRRLRAGPERCGHAALHVDAAAAVQPIALDERLERALVAVVPDRVGVAVEQQRAPAAGPAGNPDHVRAAGRDDLDVRLHAGRLEPAGDEARDLQLAGAAGYELGIDRVDRDQLGDEFAQRHGSPTPRSYPPGLRRARTVPRGYPLRSEPPSNRPKEHP